MHSFADVVSGFGRTVATFLLLALTVVTLHGQSSDPAALYQQALRRETLLRQELDAAQTGTSGGLLLDRIRILIGSFEDLARLFSKSDTTDDSLSHGGLLAADAFAKFGEGADRDTALRLLKQLAARFPNSSLARQASVRIKTLDGAKPVAASTPAQPVSGAVMLRAIRREVLPEAHRVTLELDREVGYYDERIEGPPRVFVDLPNTRAVESLKDATIPFPDDGPVKQVRIGRQLNTRTRVVLDLNGAGKHSVYVLYNPYRIVIDFERASDSAAAQSQPAPPADATTRAPAVTASSVGRTTGPAAAAPPVRATPVAEARPAPATPSSTAKGNYSLARQLGLGVTRIVIDPGHGGHDPGAHGNGISEAELVLDVAMRLEELLAKKQEFEVVLTRRTDAFVALEERTALANQHDADLFLSIHANASTAASARGIETYFLNFASNPEAEAIAVRENSGSSRHMRHLPDIVQAITLNNKLDESRDFARIVQATLYEQLRKTNSTLKNLGVKQAPFMVLVGATMPSALTEISFMSNRNEAALLKTDRYKQQIAEALMAAIVRYQGALKKSAPRAE